VVLVILLLGIGAMRSGPPLKPSDALIVDLIRESSRAGTPSAKPVVRQQEEKPKPVPPRPHIALPKPAAPPNRPMDLLELSKDEMAAADISKLGTAAGKGVAMAGNDDSPVVGRGPRGETLYAAEWAREPTSAELRGYLPRNAPDGWGLIACRTLPQNRVDDCVELGQSPRGSHLASAVRQAAWQFRVRPPRKNGKELIGEWVQIRIVYETTVINQ
jgi:protein TonB